jgi:DNA-binding NarL/FixJ family response regulator
MLRKGITDLLTQTNSLHWVGSAADGKEAIEKIRSLQPDVALLDIEMPHLDGLEVATKLIGEGIQTRFILLTLFKSKQMLQRALSAGVKGYLLKESDATEIVSCIEAVAAGKSYVNASLTHYLIPNAQDDGGNVLSSLSEHERNILRLIAQQKTTNEIAEMLFVSPKTIANHRNNISKKLQLGGQQNGLLKWAIEHRDSLN